MGACVTGLQALGRWWVSARLQGVLSRACSSQLMQPQWGVCRRQHMPDVQTQSGSGTALSLCEPPEQYTPIDKEPSST